MIVAEYKAPNNKHFKFDSIKFYKENGKLEADMHITHLGFKLHCTSNKTLRMAQKLAVQYIPVNVRGRVVSVQLRTPVRA